MALKQTRVQGELYDVGALSADDVRPGALIYCKHARKAFRIVVEDGGDMILRNMRYPDLLDAVKPEWIYENCYLIRPCK